MSRYKKLLFVCCSALLLLFAFRATALAAERLPFIDGWKFRRGDADEQAWRLTWRNLEPRALKTRDQLKPPALRENIASREPEFLIKATRPNYDDSDWLDVDIPFDAAIYEEFSYANEPTQSLLPCCEPVWFRKSFQLSEEDRGKSIFFDFDGAASRSSVWVNGVYVGGWAYGYTSFRVDATPFVKFGDSNTLVVRCDNPPQSSRWYTGNGLYRNVWLVKANETRVARWGAFIRTLDVTDGAAVVKATAEIERATSVDKSELPIEVTASIKFYRRNARGEREGEAFAATEEKKLQLKPGESVVAEFDDLRIENAPLWSPDEPNVCYAETTVYVDGKPVDVDCTSCGFRTLSYDADRGLLVNGKLYELRGFCIHHDLGALGAAYNAQADERRLLALKSIGCNAIRLSHNPSAPETIDLLSRMGFLVQAEMFDQWRVPQSGGWRAAGYYYLFDNWSEADARSLVRRDRNAPSVVMWSIGNEIPELGNENEFVRQAKRLASFAREEDPTRPVTSACNSAKAGFGEIPRVLDVFGYNYHGRVNYAKFHEQNPDVPVYGSEVICTMSSRAHYVFPVLDNNVKLSDGYVDFRQSSYAWFAFGFNREKPNQGWACPPDYEFEAQDKNPFVCGFFAWTGIDYLGAPFQIDVLSRTQRFESREMQEKAEAEKEELGAYQCPLRVCETGAFDLALFPKDIAYLYKSYWLPNEKTARVLPSWNFPDRVGEKIPVYVYTSGDSAELFLNGRSLGRREKGEYEYRLIWNDVEYEPGELRAVCYKNGELWAEDSVKTTGEPAALRLTCENSELQANGRDLAFIRLEVVDADGNLVPNAEIEVEFSVEGAGTFVASDSGNPCDLVPYNSPMRKTIGGLTSAIARAKREPGTLKIVAKAEGLRDGQIETNVVPVTP